MLRTLSALLTLALAVMAASATAAPTPKTTLNDVEDEVMCLVCGTPLNLATDAPSANDERALIRRLIGQGYSKEQIKRRLAREFGPRVLALPPQEGFNLTAYLVPIGLGLAGLGGLAVLALRWRQRRPAAASDAVTTGQADGPLDIEPSEARRLDEDLARYDG